MSEAKRIGIFVIVVCSLGFGNMGSALALQQSQDADDYDGNQLLGYCQTALKWELTGLYPNQAGMGGAVKAGMCYGYVKGVQATVEMWQSLGPVEFLYCVPEEAEVSQRVRVVVKYLEDNPEWLHFQASYLVQSAFRIAFPCAEGEQQ